MVLGELATGNLHQRVQTLAALRCLSFTQVGNSNERLEFIEMHSLYGRGIVWDDIQLLASARLSGNPLRSLDDRLDTAAADLGVAYQEK